ncbi:hypothetical protein AB733_02680 [Photobacterium swingsii]|uniref:Uncharacterized protein n=1 Tax=Photobacterium swingsii TaxID=680026 RepID=A0A0J8VGW2_9GAMM|nr:hypothetical protein [Photobacterium swingsii]KMV31720.1 hypothetical protein AB733_02680 [Photobacterium swingsii]PSW25325.1 hypothetical protein C9I94_06625 [Photobacterium swingsii]
MTATALHQTFTTIGLDQLALSHLEQKELAAFIKDHARFYDSVCQQKADKDPIDLLLGLMTKVQQETTANYQNKQSAIESMHQVFSDTIGNQQNRFVATDSHRLALETRLWLLVQGYCGIDFSYANEHAEHIASLLTISLAQPEHALRSEFLAAFYAGKTKKGEKASTHRKSSILQQIKSFFNP